MLIVLIASHEEHECASGGGRQRPLEISTANLTIESSDDSKFRVEVDEAKDRAQWSFDVPGCIIFPSVLSYCLFLAVVVEAAGYTIDLRLGNLDNRFPTRLGALSSQTYEEIGRLKAKHSSSSSSFGSLRIVTDH
jgi:hypothetical protein